VQLFNKAGKNTLITNPYIYITFGYISWGFYITIALGGDKVE